MRSAAAKFAGIILLFLVPGTLVLWHALGLDAGQRPDAAAEQPRAPDSSSDILQYISAGWDKLTRTMNRCESLEDSKTGGESVLYVPAEMSITPSLSALHEHCRVRVEHLPAKISGPGEIDVSRIKPDGLLYLEDPYVVPGGQFNEMYGWDSYFIILGLLRDHHAELAKGMVENFFFEIEHYGGILNANRTYYLTRSQPPFLSSMILAIYDDDKSRGKEDLVWLDRAYKFAVRDYQQWNQPPHLAGDTGLSRFFDRGEGPVPEIMGDPSHYYRGAADYFLTHADARHSQLLRTQDEESSATTGPRFPVLICDPGNTDTTSPGCVPAQWLALTRDFYKGDRSLRESGFDITFRFGPFGADTHHYAPVCLNSLLYKTEKDLERMSLLLEQQDQARNWNAKAVQRQQRMEKYFWDDTRGLFFDYDFTRHERSTYEYVTTFYPLWAGLATKPQASALVKNVHLFEQPGGLAMSTTESHAQWDYPYGWAPIQLLTVEGLLRYGYRPEADRIGRVFLATVRDNFMRDHTIREKYNVVTRSSETNILAGYTQNVIGFGWTNAVFLELSHEAGGAAGW